MVSLAQKCFAGCLGSEHAGLTFDAEVAIVRMASPARNPHPGDGPDPLLGPRIFRALRLGPFEGFPDGIARRLASTRIKTTKGGVCIEKLQKLLASVIGYD